MANPEHLAKLKEGFKAWNAWRKENQAVDPDLIGAELRGADLYRAELRGANLSSADLCSAEPRTAEQLVRMLACATTGG